MKKGGFYMSAKYEKPEVNVIRIEQRSILCGSPKWEEIPIEDAKYEEDIEWYGG